MRSPRLVTALVLVALLALFLALPKPPPPPPRPTPPPPTPAPPAFPLRATPPPEYRDDRDAASLIQALERSLGYLRRRPPTEEVPFGPDAVSIRDWIDTLESIQERLRSDGLTPEFLTWLQGNTRAYESTAERVTFTGYHLAALRGSRTRSDTYRYPLYRRPGDLVRVELESFDVLKDIPGLPRFVNGRVTSRRRVIPYFTREEIDFGGELEGRDLELLWVDSLVDVHSLHVQGSGVVTLDTGEAILVGFADSNGHRFRGVGEYLLTEGILPPNRVSYQDVQAYLRAHPKELRDILTKNARYIFFRELEGGPRGSLGVELTPHRSVAVDQELMPRGGLAWIETDLPVLDEDGELAGWERSGRFVLAQDAGAAIRGAGRVDLYCGYGTANETVAGALKQPGRLVFLAPPAP